MDTQTFNDLNTLVSTIHLAQSRGAYKINESETLAKNLRVLITFLNENRPAQSE